MESKKNTTSCTRHEKTEQTTRNTCFRSEIQTSVPSFSLPNMGHHGTTTTTTTSVNCFIQSNHDNIINVCLNRYHHHRILKNRLEIHRSLGIFYSVSDVMMEQRTHIITSLEKERRP
ncbi:unnamed protein product [Ectocarpus sp. 12 AP-2014]